MHVETIAIYSRCTRIAPFLYLVHWNVLVFCWPVFAVDDLLEGEAYEIYVVFEFLGKGPNFNERKRRTTNILAPW